MNIFSNVLQWTICFYSHPASCIQIRFFSAACIHCPTIPSDCRRYFFISLHGRYAVVLLPLLSYFPSAQIVEIRSSCFLAEAARGCLASHAYYQAATRSTTPHYSTANFLSHRLLELAIHRMDLTFSSYHSSLRSLVCINISTCLPLPVIY